MVVEEGWFDRVADGLVGGVAGAFRDLTQVPQGGTQSFTVNHDNVLKAGRLIHDQAIHLERLYSDALATLRVTLPTGVDGLNQDIADAWNDRLVDNDESYGQRVWQYIVSLKNLGGQLQEAARQYGYTEDEVHAAFGSTGA